MLTWCSHPIHFSSNSEEQSPLEGESQSSGEGAFGHDHTQVLREEEGGWRGVTRDHVTLWGFLEGVRALGVKGWCWSRPSSLSSHTPFSLPMVSPPCHHPGAHHPPLSPDHYRSLLTDLCLSIPASLQSASSTAARGLSCPPPSEDPPVAPSSLRRKPGFWPQPPPHCSL